MELAGDEKRIRALFSEQKFEDQNVAPLFDRLWNPKRRTQSQRAACMQPIVALGALAMIAVSFALGLRSPVPAIQEAADVSAPVESTPIEFSFYVPNKSPRLRPAVHRKQVRPKDLEHVVIQQAELLSKWQSPTNSFMESATSSVLNSLPELTQSARELESYLSNSEVKELKQ